MNFFESCGVEKCTEVLGAAELMKLRLNHRFLCMDLTKYS
jgi:hypothetical protein